MICVFLGRRIKLKFNDIFTLLPSYNRKIDFTKVKLPNNQDVFFRSKQKEIIQQYNTARIFLLQTENENWEHLFKTTGDLDADEYFKLTVMASNYESALIFYNIVIDLSWTLCYVSADYAIHYKHGKPNEFSSVASIEKAVELIRSAEKNVTNPTAEDNPFDYLKKDESRF